MTFRLQNDGSWEMQSDLTADVKVVSLILPASQLPSRYATRLYVNRPTGFTNYYQRSNDFSGCLDNHDEALVVGSLIARELPNV